MGEENGPDCTCGEHEAQDHECGCHCRDPVKSCKCPRHAHIVGNQALCDKGLEATQDKKGCVARWQMWVLVALASFGILSMACCVYYLFAVLRLSGILDKFLPGFTQQQQQQQPKEGSL